MAREGEKVLGRDIQLGSRTMRMCYLDGRLLEERERKGSRTTHRT